jgi:hypothetical protein
MIIHGANGVNNANGLHGKAWEGMALGFHLLSLIDGRNFEK